MLLDGLRTYVQLASGLTELSRQRAAAAARALLDQSTAQIGAAVPGPVREQLATLTEDLIVTARGNRALLLGLVESEVERVAGRLGLVSGDAFNRVQERADRLELRIRELEFALADSGDSAAARVGPSPPHRAKTARAAKNTITKTTIPKAAGPKAAGPKAAGSKDAGSARAATVASAAEPRKRRAPSAPAPRPHGDALLDSGRDQAGSLPRATP